MNTFDVVVVGAGPVGMQIARRLAVHHDVLVVDGDAESPGATETRAQLLHQLAVRAKSLTARPRSSPIKGVTVCPGTHVTRIDRHAQRVETDNQGAIGYRWLVLALGAEPTRPPIEVANEACIQMAYRHADIRALADSGGRGERIVIVGGGLLATELAAALPAQARVHIIVRSRLLRSYAEPAMSVRVARQLRRLKIKVESRQQVVAVNADRHGQSVRLSDGRHLRADRVVLACGMTPHTALAAQAGLTTDIGICVDTGMRTADPNIIAVGDCAQPPEGPGQGSIARGIDQTERAISTMTGSKTASAPSGPWPREIRLGRLKFMSVRRISGAADTLLARYAWRRGYALELANDRIVSGSALMPPAAIDRLRQLVGHNAGLGGWQRWQLRLGRIPSSGAPAEQIVCHCAGVTRGEITTAATTYGASLEAVGHATGAGQYCGGCRDDVKSVLTGHRPRFAWATLAAGLLATTLAALAAWVPPLDAGVSVQTLWFKAYALLTTPILRQITGYTMLAFIALALCVSASSNARRQARNRWLHMVYGTLAVVSIPAHALGGVRVGGGLNSVLNAILVACVLVGAAVWIKRSWRLLLFWHSLLTAVLLAAIALHVIYVYQY